MKRSLVIAAVVMSLLAVSAAPVGAMNVAWASNHTTSSDFSAGSTTNADVIRSDEAGAVEYDTYRSTAVARYATDYGSGSVAYDSVGANDGTINGATWASGVSGQSLDFDGSNDRVDLPDNLVSGPDTPFTASFWVNPDSVTEKSRVFALRNDLEFTTEIENGNLELWTGTFHTITTVQASTWTHFTISFDGTDEWKVYKNGELVGTVTDAPNSESDNNILGRDARTTSSYFDGRIDEVRVYEGEVLSPGLALRLSQFPSGKLSPDTTERWGLDASQGDTGFGDVGHNVSIDNGTWGQGQSGSGLSFDGDGYATAGDSSDLEGFGDTLAISAWVKLEDINGTKTIAGKEDVYKLDVNSGEFRFLTGEAWSGSMVKSGITPQVGQWYHIVGVYDGSEKRLYINGQLTGTVSTSGSVGTSNDEFGIGAYSSGTWEGHLNGTVDEVRVFQDSISEDSVTHLHDHPNAQIPELSSYTGTWHDVSNATKVYVDLSLTNSTANVTVEAGSGGSPQTTLNTTSYSSSGNKTIEIDESGYDQIRVKVDLSETDPDNLARVHAEGVGFVPAASSVSGATPSGNITASDGQLSIDVTDPDFGTAQGDSVEVEFRDASDDSLIETDTLTSNGTASVQWSGLQTGDKSWYVEISDSYGTTTQSQTYYFVVPSELTLFNESAPSQQISNADLEVRFFSTDGDTVVTRSAPDGTVDLSGFPATEEFLVVANADGYYSRRILIDSLVEQQEIYLLPENETARFNQFVLDDKTGDYPADSTKLIIQRALTKDFDDDSQNETQWVRIGGDYFGAQNRYPIDLETQVQYRLIARSNTNSVVLGRYIAREEGAVTLTLGRIQFEAPQGTQYYMVRNLDSKANEFQLRWVDKEDLTTQLDVSIYERGNTSNVLFQTSVNDPTPTETFVVDSLSEEEKNTAWVVQWNATRDGKQLSNKVLRGGNAALLPMAAKWLGTLGLLFLTVLGALGGERLATIFSIGMVGIAGVLMLFQWVSIPVPMFWAAGLVAVLGHIKKSAGA